MPGHYSTRCRPRPCGTSDSSQSAAARLFVCARCRLPVVVCSHCDRGQIYCAGTCAQEARQQAQRAAGQRYQTSRCGRLKHAARTSRYRTRQKIVTHQGSLPEPRDGVVRSAATTFATPAAVKQPATASSHDKAMRSQNLDPEFWRCHWCERRCPPLVRQELLRRRGSRRGQQRGPHDHST